MKPGKEAVSYITAARNAKSEFTRNPYFKQIPQRILLEKYDLMSQRFKIPAVGSIREISICHRKQLHKGSIGDVCVTIEACKMFGDYDCFDIFRFYSGEIQNAAGTLGHSDITLLAEPFPIGIHKYFSFYIVIDLIEHISNLKDAGNIIQDIDVELSVLFYSESENLKRETILKDQLDLPWKYRPITKSLIDTLQPSIEIYKELREVVINEMKSLTLATIEKKYELDDLVKKYMGNKGNNKQPPLLTYKETNIDVNSSSNNKKLDPIMEESNNSSSSNDDYESESHIEESQYDGSSISPEESQYDSSSKTPESNNSDVKDTIKLLLDSYYSDSEFYKRVVKRRPPLEIPDLDPPKQKRKYTVSDETIETLDDLITFGETADSEFEYAIDIDRLKEMVPELKELQEVIGMQNVKNKICNQLVFLLSGLLSKDGEFMNLVITGTPGIGKTMIATILVKIYKKSGIVRFDQVHFLKSKDLIGKYIGHTDHDSLQKLNECKGGVIVIDEAYTMNDERDGKCPFGTKALSILNQFLSENLDTMCIIMGYKEKLEKTFFAANEGLKRRFPWHFEIEDYDADELLQIFELKAKKQNFEITFTSEERTEAIAFINNNRKLFQHNGSDMLTLLTYVKEHHSRNILSKTKEEKRNITYDSFDSGLKSFVATKKSKTKIDEPPSHMYM